MDNLKDIIKFTFIHLPDILSYIFFQVTLVIVANWNDSEEDKYFITKESSEQEK